MGNFNLKKLHQKSYYQSAVYLLMSYRSQIEVASEIFNLSKDKKI